jgi:hypothetical protein
MMEREVSKLNVVRTPNAPTSLLNFTKSAIGDRSDN